MDPQPHLPTPERERALAFFRWFCAPRWQEELEGDLIERFVQRRDAMGLRRARRALWADVLRLFRPYIIRRSPSPYATAHPMTMWTHYLRTALRAVQKAPGYSALNVLGLSLGLAASLLMLIFVQHELTYDRFHENADRIYQVYKERTTPTGVQITRDTWVPMRDAFVDTYPQVEAATRLFTYGVSIESGTDRTQEAVTFADPNVFEVFTFPLALGDPQTALNMPESIVLSADAAERYFGTGNPIGRTLVMEDESVMTVTGVLAPVPSNSTLQPDFFVSFTTLPFYEETREDWGSSFLETYVLLRPGEATEALEAQFPDFIAARWGPEEPARTAFGLEALPELQQALTDNRPYAYILLVVALAILAIACINFTNIATARSLERAREIGVRKALGAGRGQLASQFLSESVLLSLGSLAVGVGLAALVLPFFNDLYGLRLSLVSSLQGWGLPLLLGLGLTVGLIAGAYPALLLSGFRPVASLKGRRGDRGTRSVLRRGLVVTQFAMAVALLVGTFVVRDQVAFMKNANLNLDRENVIVLPVAADDFADVEAMNARLQTFKQTLRQYPEVRAVSASSHMPGNWVGWFTFIYPNPGDDERHRMRVAYMDDQFFDAYGMQLVEGRTFDESLGETERSRVILNEAAARAFGWTESAGRTLYRGDTELEVIGVVEDYHFQSLAEDIEPVLHFFRTPENQVHDYVSVRFEPGSAAEHIALLETAWEVFAPETEPSFIFVDERFRQLYAQEERLATLVGSFTLLGLLVALLGLFGLVSLVVQQRTKEISVRKVLGATLPGLIMLLAREYTWLVVGAIAVAVPVAYLGASRWLEGFAYHTAIGPGRFLLAAVLVLAVSWIAISYHSIKTALTNPAETLRYE